jgi:hypothetical protein
MQHVWKHENAYIILGGKPPRKKPRGRLGHRGKDNIKMDDREIRCEGLETGCNEEMRGLM